MILWLSLSTSIEQIVIKNGKSRRLFQKSFTLYLLGEFYHSLSIKMQNCEKLLELLQGDYIIAVN